MNDWDNRSTMKTLPLSMSTESTMTAEEARAELNDMRRRTRGADLAGEFPGTAVGERGTGVNLRPVVDTPSLSEGLHQVLADSTRVIGERVFRVISKLKWVGSMGSAAVRGSLLLRSNSVSRRC
jgi:hypothetical protein